MEKKNFIFDTWLEGQVLLGDEEQKEFEKTVGKFSGKMLLSLKDTIQEVMNAKNMNEITDCKRLFDYKYVYRIRVGSYRAFFTFHVGIIDDTVIFQYLVSRGEAYDKKSKQNLKKRDL